MSAKIYALIDPIDDRIRYVGQTRQELNARLHQHWRDRNQNKEKNQHKANWINKLYNVHNQKPIIQIIEEIKNEDDLFINERERYWIDYYNNLGCDLTNTSGKMYFYVTRKKNKSSSKVVYAYDKQMNEYKFDNARRASEFTKISHKRISKICNGERTHLNFFFSFVKLSNEELTVLFKPKHKKGSILATEIKTGNEIIFSSQMDAAKYFNCNFRNINQVLKKLRKSCKGHFFSYIDNDDN